MSLVTPDTNRSVYVDFTKIARDPVTYPEMFVSQPYHAGAVGLRSTTSSEFDSRGVVSRKRLFVNEPFEPNDTQYVVIPETIDNMRLQVAPDGVPVQPLRPETLVQFNTMLVGPPPDANNGMPQMPGDENRLPPSEGAPSSGPPGGLAGPATGSARSSETPFGFRVLSGRSSSDSTISSSGSSSTPFGFGVLAGYDDASRSISLSSRSLMRPPQDNPRGQLPSRSPPGYASESPPEYGGLQRAAPRARSEPETVSSADIPFPDDDIDDENEPSFEPDEELAGAGTPDTPTVASSATPQPAPGGFRRARSDARQALPEFDFSLSTGSDEVSRPSQSSGSIASLRQRERAMSMLDPPSLADLPDEVDEMMAEQEIDSEARAMVESAVDQINVDLHDIPLVSDRVDAARRALANGAGDAAERIGPQYVSSGHRSVDALMRSIGLPARPLEAVFESGFYATQDRSTPIDRAADLIGGLSADNKDEVDSRVVLPAAREMNRIMLLGGARADPARAAIAGYFAARLAVYTRNQRVDAEFRLARDIYVRETESQASDPVVVLGRRVFDAIVDSRGENASPSRLSLDARNEVEQLNAILSSGGLSENNVPMPQMPGPPVASPEMPGPLPSDSDRPADNSGVGQPVFRSSMDVARSRSRSRARVNDSSGPSSAESQMSLASNGAVSMSSGPSTVESQMSVASENTERGVVRPRENDMYERGPVRKIRLAPNFFENAMRELAPDIEQWAQSHAFGRDPRSGAPVTGMPSPETPQFGKGVASLGPQPQQANPNVISSSGSVARPPRLAGSRQIPNQDLMNDDEKKDDDEKVDDVGDDVGELPEAEPLESAPSEAPTSTSASTPPEEKTRKRRGREITVEDQTRTFDRELSNIAAGSATSFKTAYNALRFLLTGRAKIPKKLSSVLKTKGGTVKNKMRRMFLLTLFQQFRPLITRGTELSEAQRRALDDEIQRSADFNANMRARDRDEMVRGLALAAFQRIMDADNDDIGVRDIN